MIDLERVDFDDWPMGKEVDCTELPVGNNWNLYCTIVLPIYHTVI